MPRYTRRCFLALVGVAPLSTAQNPVPQLPAGVTPEMVASGKTLFLGSGLCTACHGPEGKGGVGPDLTDSVWLSGKGTFEDIAGRIKSGISADSSASGNAMPPLGGSGLSEAEVHMVAAYVWTLSSPRKLR